VTVWQTVLVFVVAPLGGLMLLAVLVFGATLSRTPRYRPGRPWEHDPVWYVAHPDGGPPPGAAPGNIGAGSRAALSAPRRRALTGRGTPPASVLDAPARTARGGANGQW
jgi:hypothetical protein